MILSDLKRALTLALVMSFSSAPAWAAEEEETEAKEEATDAEAAPAKTEANDVDPLATTDDGKTDSKETGTAFPRIADEEETIYAVQEKAYLVHRKIELTPMFAATFSDRFVQTFAPALSVTYHVAENFGIELYGAYMLPSESALTTELLNVGKLTPEVAKLTQMLWSAGLGVQWSPIYGKIQAFGASLGNFSFYVGAGAGMGQTRVQCLPGRALDPFRGYTDPNCPELTLPSSDPESVNERVFEPSRLQLMGSFSGGVRFYFSNSIGLKFEVKNYVFSTRVYRPESMDPTQRFTDAIRNNIFAQLGLSFLFGGGEKE